MNREDRAKQFAPFDALKGLREALREKEIEHERQQKKELSDEDAKELEKTIKSLSKGDTAEILYFKDGYYITKSINIEKIDTVFRHIKTSENTISFDHISRIKKL